jgi:hypothetical protein
VERIPQELAAATKQAEQAARSEAQKQAELEAKVARLETDAARNVTALKISGLEDLVKRQAAQQWNPRPTRSEVASGSIRECTPPS